MMMGTFGGKGSHRGCERFMASRERKWTNLNKIKSIKKEDEKYELKSFVISFMCIFVEDRKNKRKTLNVHMEIVSFSFFNLDFCGFEKRLTEKKMGLWFRVSKVLTWVKVSCHLSLFFH